MRRDPRKTPDIQKGYRGFAFEGFLFRGDYSPLFSEAMAFFMAVITVGSFSRSR